jgi:hypothetical protein
MVKRIWLSYGTSPALRLFYSLVLLGLLGMLVLGNGGQPAHAAGIQGFFEGQSFGSRIHLNVGPVNDEVGKTALLPCPCLGTNGSTLKIEVAGVNAAPVLTTGVIKTTTTTNKGASEWKMAQTAEIAGVKLFNNLITADLLLASAKAVANATTTASSDGGSKFVGLKVNGKTILNPAINARIDLHGIGYVVLNERTFKGNGKGTSHIHITLIHVYVTTQNVFGLPVGAEVIVSDASAGFVRSAMRHRFGGVAYVSDATSTALGIVTKLGKVAPVWVPCNGTGKKPRTNTIDSLKVKNLLSAGTGNVTAGTTVSGSNATVTTTSAVEKLNVLKGLVTADAISAVSKTSLTNGQVSHSTDGSKIVNLRILGLPVQANLPPNTRRELLGFGYIVFREEQIKDGQLTLNMIHLYITTANLYNIPIGTEVVVGVARSSINPF